jgi:hypothetical protein
MSTSRKASMSVVRYVRGAIESIEEQREAIEVPRALLERIASELSRLSSILEEDRLWDPLDVGRFFGISRNSVYAQVDAGTLPCVRIGGLLKFDPVKIRAIGRGELRPEGRGRVAALPVVGPKK